MQISFAPMEGVTCAAFRRVHHQFYKGVERYFIPFIAPSADYHIKGRALRELDAASLKSFCAIPQILTKNPQDFLHIANLLAEMGFSEVNLNCGCPSGTVVAKGKGAGMLQDLQALDAFLECIFRESPLPISVKTRLGLTDAAEFDEILRVYNRYPIRELVIHPRTRTDFYKGGVHMDAFAAALQSSKNPVSYNGNLFTFGDCSRLVQTYPSVRSMMLGRGLCANPALAEGKLERSRLQAFHTALCEQYYEAYGSWQVVLPRMKELWFYLLHSFSDDGKYAKKLHKAVKWPDFYAVIQQLFECVPLRKNAAFTDKPNEN